MQTLSGKLQLLEGRWFARFLAGQSTIISMFLAAKVLNTPAAPLRHCPARIQIGISQQVANWGAHWAIQVAQTDFFGISHPHTTRGWKILPHMVNLVQLAVQVTINHSWPAADHCYEAKSMTNFMLYA